jgi:hypothetical protein
MAELVAGSGERFALADAEVLIGRLSGQAKPDVDLGGLAGGRTVRATSLSHWPFAKGRR